MYLVLVCVAEFHVKAIVAPRYSRCSISQLLERCMVPLCMGPGSCLLKWVSNETNPNRVNQTKP